LLNFLQPIWLYAISGIIIPIAIHFWNIKEGKALPVGSIALLEKSTKKYTSTLRITEWLLLILRCLLIIVLAMLLAKPVKQQKLSDKGWILIDKQNTNTVYNHFKSIVDSLLDKGFELHNFDEGFKRTNLKDALASEDTISNQAQYWSLIKKADSQLPASFPVYVFTSNHLKNFTGEKPQVTAVIRWFTYSTDTTVKHVAKAWLTDENNIRVMLANSTPSGNMFDYDDVLLQQHQNSDYTISSNGGQLSVSYNNQAPVDVDSTVMHISIYAGKNKQDANYIKAAIDAIKTFTKRRIETTISGSLPALPQKTDWLFWLSNNVLPKNISAGNVFKYGEGEEADEVSIINTNHTAQQSINIIKRIIADTLPATSEQVLWKDGFGNPLLIKQGNNDTTVYNFYSHFNPQWNDLVWSDAFPTILLQLIFEDEITNIHTISPDERIIDAKQMQPVFVSDPKKIVASSTDDLSTIFWIIIFLLFCAERVVSFKTKNNSAV